MKAFLFLNKGLNYALKLLLSRVLGIFHPNGANEVDRDLSMVVFEYFMLYSTREGHYRVIVELVFIRYFIRVDKISWFDLIL